MSSSQHRSGLSTSDPFSQDLLPEDIWHHICSNYLLPTDVIFARQSWPLFSTSTPLQVVTPPTLIERYEMHCEGFSEDPAVHNSGLVAGFSIRQSQIVAVNLRTRQLLEPFTVHALGNPVHVHISDKGTHLAVVTQDWARVLEVGESKLILRHQVHLALTTGVGTCHRSTMPVSTSVAFAKDDTSATVVRFGEKTNDSQVLVSLCTFKLTPGSEDDEVKTHEPVEHLVLPVDTEWNWMAVFGMVVHQSPLTILFPRGTVNHESALVLSLDRRLSASGPKSMLVGSGVCSFQRTQLTKNASSAIHVAQTGTNVLLEEYEIDSGVCKSVARVPLEKNQSVLESFFVTREQLVIILVGEMEEKKSTATLQGWHVVRYANGSRFFVAKNETIVQTCHTNPFQKTFSIGASGQMLSVACDAGDGEELTTIKAFVTATGDCIGQHRCMGDDGGQFWASAFPDVKGGRFMHHVGGEDGKTLMFWSSSDNGTAFHVAE